MSKAWHLKLTWPKEAKCFHCNTLAFRGGDVFDTVEEAIEHVKYNFHHRRGNKSYLPLTVEFDYDIDDDSLPKSVAETNMVPMPLAGPPKKLKKEEK